MMKKFFNGEEGIALTVAAVITVILFLIASAYFISTQSENTRALADKAGVKAIDVANAGAERAIWNVQQELDNNPDWQPAGNEMRLFGNYDYFENLSEQDKKNPDKYAKECIQVGSTVPGETSGSIGGVGSKVYAVKMRREDDPTTDQVEWAIYSLGIDRSSDILGGKMEMRVTRVIVQLGATVEFPDDLGMYGGGPQTSQSVVNQRFHISGGRINPVLYMEGGWNDNGDIILDGYPGRSLGKVESGKKKGDGWDPNSRFRFQTLQGNPEPGNSSVRESISYGTRDIPNLRLENLKDIADYYITNTCEVAGDMRDLRNLGWQLSDEKGNIVDMSYPGPKSLVPPYDRQILIWKNYDPNLVPREWQPGQYDNYTDITGKNGQPDGYTIFYIPPGDINIRFGYGKTPICVMSGEGNLTRAIIASEGKGRNFYDESAASCPELGGQVFVRGREYDFMASDKNLNENVGVDIRGVIAMLANNGKEIGKKSFMDFIWNPDTNDIDVGGIDKGIVTDRPNNKIIGSQTGCLSILSKYDVSLTTTGCGLHDSSSFYDPQSIMRGLIYSEEGKIRLQTDLLLRGSIMAKKGIEFVDSRDPNQVTRALVQSGDGYDFALCFEDVTNLDDGTHPALVSTVLPQTGGGIMRILSWENINGRQIQKTF